MVRKPTAKIVGQQKARKEQSSRRTAIIVLGMHRSGTSALARVLNILGCDLPENLLPPSANDNDLGFWESKPLIDLDMQILESAGTRWDDWQPFNPGWLTSPRSTEFKSAALKIVAEEFGNSHFFVIKEPRICRFAPFWFDVLDDADVDVRIIIPIRNPVEVAASLAKRSGHEPAHSYLIWLRHVLDAECASRGRPRYFTSYDKLLTNWVKLVMDASAVLGITWPRFSEKARSEVAAFLSDKYRHHRAPGDFIEDIMVAEWLRETFRIFTRWADVGEDTGDFDTLDRIRSELDTATPAFARLITVGSEASRRVAILEKSAADLHAKLVAEEKSAAETKAKAQSLSDELEGVRQQLTARAHEIEQLIDQRDAANKKASVEAAEAQSLSRELGGVRQESSNLTHEIEHLARQRDAANKRASEDSAKATERQAELETVTAELKRDREALRDITGELADLSARSDTAEREAQARISFLESALAQRRAEADEVTSALEVAKANLANAETELKERSEALASFVQEKEEVRAEAALQLAEAKNSIEQLETTAVEDRARIETAIDRERVLGDDLASLGEKLARAQSDHDAARQENRGLNDRLAKQLGEIVILTRVIRDTEVRGNKSIEVERQHAQKAISENEQRTTELREQLNSLQVKMAGDVVEHETIVRSRETELAELKLIHVEALEESKCQIGDLRVQLEAFQTKAAADAAAHEEAVRIKETELAAFKGVYDETIAETRKQALDLRAQLTAVHARTATEAATSCKIQKELESELQRLTSAQKKAHSSSQFMERRLSAQIDEIVMLTQLAREGEIRMTEIDRLEQARAETQSQRIKWMERVVPILLNGAGSWREVIWRLAPAKWRWARQKEMLRRRELFDEAAYLRANPDVALASFDALQHYLQYGLAEGRALAKTETINLKDDQ